MQLRVQQLESELQQTTDAVACLDAQLMESHEMVAAPERSKKAVQAAAEPRRKKGSSGPAGAIGWVLRAGATVGGTILAGHAVQHYQAQQPKKGH